MPLALLVAHFSPGGSILEMSAVAACFFLVVSIFPVGGIIMGMDDENELTPAIAKPALAHCLSVIFSLTGYVALRMF